MKLLSSIANIAVIIGVTVFLVLVGRSQFGRPTANGDLQKLIGTTISLPGVQFPLQRTSIILALSTACHFCKDSLPFYKTLAGDIQGKADLIAVFPQTESEGRAYVDGAALSVAKVVSTDLSTIGVYGTPSVILIDRYGKIGGVWRGLLNKQGQDQLIASVPQ